VVQQRHPHLYRSVPALVLFHLELGRAQKPLEIVAITTEQFCRRSATTPTFPHQLPVKLLPREFLDPMALVPLTGCAEGDRVPKPRIAQILKGTRRYDS